jgi:hypothetical protein
MDTKRRDVHFRKTNSNRNAVLYLGILLSVVLAPYSAPAIELADPATFQVDTLVTFPDGRTATSLAFPPTSSAEYPAYMYATSNTATAATGSLHTVTEEGLVNRFGSSLQDELRLYFASLESGPALCGVDPGHPYSYPDGLYSVDTSGVLTLLNDLGGGNPDCGGMVYAGGTSFGDYILLANPTDGAGSSLYRDNIVKLAPSGSYVGELASHDHGPLRMALSKGGSFGEFVYFVVLQSSNLYRVSPGGAIELFATLADYPLYLEFGAGCDFGTDLYVSVGGSAPGIVRVDTLGDTHTFASDVISLALAFEPAGGDMFVTEGSNILRIRGTCSASTSSEILGSTLNLAPVSPNPFKTTTEIHFALDITSRAWLDVFDLQGRLVRSLLAGETRSAGEHRVSWDGRDTRAAPVGAGVYFVRLRTDNTSRVVRAILLR